MVATFVFRQNFAAVTFGAEGITAVAVNGFFNDIYSVAFGTMPTRLTVCTRVKNPVAIGTTPVVGRTSVTDGVLRLTIGTVPNVGTGLSDFQNGFVFGTIPIIGIIADETGFMMFAAGCAIPVMVALFVGRQDPLTIRTNAIAVDVGLRAVMLCTITGANPIVPAVSTQSISLLALFAIPQVIAMRIRRIRLLTVRTEPIILRTNVVHGVVCFAHGACPITVTMLRFLQNRVAFRTIKASFLANVIQRMTLHTGGTIPEIFACFADVANGLAGRTIPAVRIRSGTNIIRRVVYFAGIAVPVVRTIVSDRQSSVFRSAVEFTAGTRLSHGIRTVANGTIPGMCALRLRVVYRRTFETIPIVVQTGFA